jgi:hypothetical protein
MPRSAPHPTTALTRFRRAGWPARLAALAGILAVLLQGALPIAHPARAAESDRRYADYLSVFGAAATLSLCRIDAAALGGDRPSGPGAAHPRSSCPICLAALHAASLPPPVGVVTPAPAQIFEIVLPVADAAGSPVATAIAAQPRAPPLPV